MAQPKNEKRKLRIGIDCRTMLNPLSGERAGVGHYTFHLVKAVLAADRRNTYVLYFDHRMPAAVTEAFVGPRVTVRRFPFSRYGKFLPYAYAHVLIAGWLTRDRLDVFHATANVAPMLYRGRTVVTVHDLAIYRHPAWFPTQPASTKVLVPQTLARAEAIIAVSQATKRDLQKLFHVPARRIAVIYEAADTNRLALRDRDVNVFTAYKLPPQYFLYVGTIDPRKSLPTLFQAWQRLRQARPALTKQAALVLAGGIGYRGDEIMRLIKKLGDPSIHYLGYVSHNHKIQLLRQATAFIFPTLYEGFGLPVLEAMQLGTPVISTATSSIPEVAGEAAVLVQPGHVTELTKAMQRILATPSLGQKLRRAGRLQAKKFSWSKVARETIAVYERVGRSDDTA